MIGGNGSLKNDVIKQVEKFNKKNSFIGRMPDEKFVETLNNLKLLILPSFTEGIPDNCFRSDGL